MQKNASAPSYIICTYCLYHLPDDNKKFYSQTRISSNNYHPSPLEPDDLSNFLILY
jgi:hypothetical protein